MLSPIHDAGNPRFATLTRDSAESEPVVTPPSPVLPPEIAEVVPAAVVETAEAVHEVTTGRVGRRGISAGLLCGFVAGGVFARYAWPHRHGIFTWVFASRRHQRAGFHGFHENFLLHRDGFCIGYNTNWRHASWVSYYTCRFSQLHIAQKRSLGDAFATDFDLPKEARVVPSDFNNCGYDKGHMAPSRMMRFSHTAAMQTFLMSNVVPQVPAINRGVWKAIETDIRKWSVKGKLAVVVGAHHERPPPPENTLLRVAGRVAVPTHFFMAVTHCRSGESIAFYVPNNEHAAKAAEAAANAFHEPWTPFVLTLDQLSARIGHRVFAQLPWWQRPWWLARRRVHVRFWQEAAREGR